ncbi:S8 family peptidase [Bacillus safensis]|uniref:S8 family peptidase n=1 Tax=Bacillus safensis TaxID=561879 RepID=UPI0004D98E70|nr:S8 family peptidase [Bacillus safensis]KEP29380.1 hypothetical protein ER50_12675 [Bacillus safensis]TFV11325.1 S8 family peptidase [Bacillus stratosphericus]WHX76989.1 S8 family peptidase [Bacillus safensis]WHX84446.1 S8 family peptidase [Bacillus safensis]
MDNNEPKYLPIIGYGENLIEPSKKKFGSNPPKFPQTYKEARTKVQEDLKKLRSSISSIPQNKKMDEVVVTVRLNEKFLAKSYTPNSLFKASHFENIGSRRWRKQLDDENDVLSKMHFVKITSSSLDALENALSKEESDLTGSFKKDVQKLEELSILQKNEVIQGFDHDWQEGTVEFVLHPFGNENKEVIDKFSKLLKENGIDMDSLRIKEYHEGPIFISAFVKRQLLKEVADFNPLRTVHPLRVNLFPSTRSFDTNELQLFPPKGEYISPLKVGVFDGGIDESNPFLSKFAKENESVASGPILPGIKHGTQVAGVILYGDLNQYDNNTQLEDPLVTVESFRVLPQSDPRDFDLYEAINLIETVVPSRKDIDVYNLSFGPIGPIIDDEISRFTYSLDRLAWNYRKLFVVAVGNDGDKPSPMNRVQAPADLVNGLGVGSFTYDYGSKEKVRAFYSCIGMGREGCKVKPDLVAFGGDDKFPIHLLALDMNKKELSAGTSFSSPFIAGKAAEIMGRCNQFDSLSARALLIHSAIHPEKVDDEIGYGFLNKNVDDILGCDENKVTIVYSASINPKAVAKLLIPVPLNSNLKGEISLSWTFATLSKANALHAEDYTESAIEHTFYPHSKKFSFSKKGKSKILHIEKDADKIKELLREGWQQSLQPVSSSPHQYQTELARRGELKWDTVVKNWKKMRSSSLEQPFLLLHGMGRNGSSYDRMDYSAVITIHAPKYAGNLYEDILNEYKVLQPVSIRSRNQVLLRV